MLLGTVRCKYFFSFWATFEKKFPAGVPKPFYVSRWPFCGISFFRKINKPLDFVLDSDRDVFVPLAKLIGQVCQICILRVQKKILRVRLFQKSLFPLSSVGTASKTVLEPSKIFPDIYRNVWCRDSQIHFGCLEEQVKTITIQENLFLLFSISCKKPQEFLLLIFRRFLYCAFCVSGRKLWGFFF